MSEQDVESAKELQAETGAQMFDTLIRIGAVDEDALINVVAHSWSMPVFADRNLPADEDAVTEACAALGLNRRTLDKLQAIVWWEQKSDTEVTLCLGARNPRDPLLRETIDQAVMELEQTNDGTSIHIVPGLISKSSLEMLLSYLSRNDLSDNDLAGDSDLARLRELAEEAPTIDLVNQIFAAAIKRRASDIHLEPYEKTFDIRFRVDGVIQSWQNQPRQRFDAVSTRIKLISNMDISERRLPQDGRQSIRLSGQQFDLRVSSLPGAWGESLVLRLLKKNNTLPSLSDLGLTGRSMTKFHELIESPNGIVLITGPTGSGKSTTLYKGLDVVNDGHKKIITIEDPIEFEMERITQTQVKSDIGFTFAKGLRSILRQDPDVIMIGEIRDPETAAIAVQASLTGHLVLSTLHTNSSLLAISRLRDLGLQPFLIGSAVRGLAAQRLVRRVCPHCAEPASAPEELELLLAACADEAQISEARSNAPNLQWKRAKGCDACSGTGYVGRIALFEIVTIDSAMRDLTLDGATMTELEVAARSQGFRRLAEDGLDKAMKGITTVSEVLRAAVGQSDQLDGENDA
ncbi:MAG: GspE/PulE family protein [Henriciella sp.]